MHKRHAAKRLRQILERRCLKLKEALQAPTEHWKVYPFNAGCFCLLLMREGLNAEEIRQKLIHDESVGVVSQGERMLRLAFCSMKEESVEPLVAALRRVCDKMWTSRGKHLVTEEA